MKKYIIYLLSLSMGTMVACKDDFLEKDLITSKTTESFYKTPADAFEGLVATYSVLPYDDYGNIYLMSEIASDNTFGGAGKTDGFGHNYWDWFQSENNLNQNAWRKYYIGIYRANVLINNLSKVSWGSPEALKAQYEAEARFLRAYYYFDLVRLFGNVPLITKPLLPGEYEQPQAKPEDVYTQIAEDLKFAIETLPNTPYAGIKPADYGRATKWAAEALMGRVFLFYTGYYQKNDLAGVINAEQAKTYIDDVVNNSGYGLVPDFRKLWRAASWKLKDYVGEDNMETVFAIKHTHKGMGWNNSGEVNGNRWQKFLGLRNQNIYPYAGGWGFMTVNPKLWEAYSNDDTRKTATIINIQEETPTFSTDDQRQYTGFAPKKYTPTLDENEKPTVVNMGANEMLDGFDDYVVIRFADVLLMAAELRLLTGGDAQKPFDDVRKRAYKDAFQSIPVTKETIMNERRLELALEGHRYWDLLRQGLSAAKQAIDNDHASQELKVNFRQETGGFFKIPESQINLSNGAMKQNQGW